MENSPPLFAIGGGIVTGKVKVDSLIPEIFCVGYPTTEYSISHGACPCHPILYLASAL
jgi:hypothetical protein